MAHAPWHLESTPTSAEPQWKHDVAEFGNAAIYYTTLGFYDPTMYAEPWAWKAKGYSWAGAVGMTGARLLGMFVLGSMIADPAHQHRWGLDEIPWWQENVEIYYSPVQDAPGDVWDWLGIKSGRGILG